MQQLVLHYIYRYISRRADGFLPSAPFVPTFGVIGFLRSNKLAPTFEQICSYVGTDLLVRMDRFVHTYEWIYSY